MDKIFDETKVYTGLNIREVPDESQGYFSMNLYDLKSQVENKDSTSMFMGVDKYEYAIDDNNDVFPFFYLVETKEESLFNKIVRYWKNNPADLYIGKNSFHEKVEGMITGINYVDKMVDICGDSYTVEDFYDNFHKEN